MFGINSTSIMKSCIDSSHDCTGYFGDSTTVWSSTSMKELFTTLLRHLNLFVFFVGACVRVFFFVVLSCFKCVDELLSILQNKYEKLQTLDHVEGTRA